jgi:N,N'-diacetylchitobiose transport system substrate-binding protein
MKKTMVGLAAFATASALVLAGCSSSGDDTPSAAPSDTGMAQGDDITLWLMGAPDTPADLVTYLEDQYKAQYGGTLTVEAVAWGDALAKLTTALPDAANTPDVVEIGNTWAPTFTSVGAFSDISDMYDELGGTNLLQSFVDVGSVDGKEYALPYYFGSRNVWYRKDLYAQGGVEVPTTLQDFTTVNATLKSKGIAGAYVGGQDWRNAISWIFAYGGDLAKKDGDTWSSTFSDAKSIEGLTAWQELFKTASVAQSNDTDANNYFIINDNQLQGLPAASSMAPTWASCCIGDPGQDDDGNDITTWNDEKDGAYALPGVDGGIAPVFAGGSNIGISAASTHQESARDLLRIIFSDEYQNMLGENGLGPANNTAKDSFVTDDFRQIAWDAAQGSKLTPAAPGWAAVEGSGLLEEFFQKIAEGGDITALAAEYDQKIDALLNG